MSLRIMVKMAGRNLAQEWPIYASAMEPYLQKCHTENVLGAMADFIAWSRVDTGRMRAGWLPILVVHQYPYQQFLGIKEGDPIAVAEGISASRSTEDPFHTIIENGVKYTQYVESEEGVFDQSGTSSYMRAPVANIPEAMLRISNKMVTEMQNMIDSMAAAWNAGAGNYSKLEPPTILPTEQD